MSTKEAIRRFCKAEIMLKNIQRDNKDTTRDLNQKQKSIKADLFQVVETVPEQCLRLDNEESVSEFVRIVNTQTQRKIQPEMIEHAIMTIEDDDIRDIMDSKQLSSLDAFILCIMSNLKEQRTIKKQSLTLSKNKPNMYNVADIPVANETTQNLVSQLQNVQEQLKTHRRKLKQKQASFKDDRTSSEPHLIDFLSKCPNQRKTITLRQPTNDSVSGGSDSQSDEVAQSIPTKYELRVATTTVKPSLTTKFIEKTIRVVCNRLLSEIEQDNYTFYNMSPEIRTRISNMVTRRLQDTLEPTERRKVKFIKCRT